MAAIEVKGGQVSIADGQWYHSDRSQRRKIQSPVAQSQSSLHALKNWIENQLGSRLSSRCVYMMSLPYTNVPGGWTMAGCPRSLILDQTESKSPAELVRQAIENEGGGAAPLAPVFLERIVRRLGGNLGTAVVPTSQEDEAAQNHLTERQSVLLQATLSLPRIRFTGGAGSGKTWLAVEKARMLSKQGKRVGLCCYNKGLGQHLQDRVETWRRQAKPVFTGEFHEYVRGLGVPDGQGQDYFDVEMPRLLKELAAGMEPHEQLDAVIVDEEQDFAPLWWDALLACTTDPNAGEVYAFMDETGRTSTNVGEARRQTSPMVRRLPSCPSTSTTTSATPARSLRHSSLSPASISRRGAAPACLYGSWTALRRSRSTSLKTV
jgi:hypothetical protein